MKTKCKGWSVFLAICFFVLLTSLGLGEAVGATYYSSPTGSGTVCSSAGPCSLQTGLGKLMAGDTLYLKNGTFNNSINVPASGTSANPITIKAENDGQAIVDGQGVRRPLLISGKSYVDVEGIVFKNSSSSVVSIEGGSSYINIRRCSGYNSATGNYHIFQIYSASYNLIEDCIASQTNVPGTQGRYLFLAYGGANYNTFRRNYGKYYHRDNPDNNPAAASANYNSSYNLWENNVFDTSEMTAGSGTSRINIFGTAQQGNASNNVYKGNVAISGSTTEHGHVYAESLTPSAANWQFIDNVFINGSTNTPYGIRNNAGTGTGWTVQNNTFVNTTSNMTYAQASGITITTKDNSYVTGNIGLLGSSGSITSSYDNFYSVSTLYSGNVTLSKGKSINPSYNTTTYGKGAYLMVASVLEGQGESGADIGATVLYQYQDGVLTNVPLWPWPMEYRVMAELGISVTYSSNGGLWNSLNGVYITPPPTDTTAPSTPAGLSAAVVSSSQINLAWTASTDNVGVAGYKVYRNGAQVATSSGTSYADTGLSPSTTYTYTVSAYDAAGNASPQSGSVSATTQASAQAPDITPPSTPAGLAAAVISSTQINLSWTASTDNVGVAGYRVYRNGSQIATTTSTSYANTGLTPSTTYTYTVSAYDAAGNASSQSGSVSATTQATGDLTPPSTPGGLTARAVSSAQINLSWTASTDKVGVAGYRIYRNGKQIATTAGTKYSNRGLSPSTTYTYTVSAYDAAGNASPQSGPVSAKTLSAAASAF
jgi:chitodextrinase